MCIIVLLLLQAILYGRKAREARRHEIVEQTIRSLMGGPSQDSQTTVQLPTIGKKKKRYDKYNERAEFRRLRPTSLSRTATGPSKLRSRDDYNDKTHLERNARCKGGNATLLDMVKHFTEVLQQRARWICRIPWRLICS